VSVKTLLYNLLANKHRSAAIRQMRQLESGLKSAGERFRVPFKFQGKGHFRTIRPKQNEDEVRRLFNMVCKLRPKRVLEIGTARGGTLYLWAQAAAPDATIVSVDLPGGPFGGAYPECRTLFYESFAQEHQQVHLMRADSHHAGTLKFVRQLFNDQPIDFLFIDGDHTYEGVKADFQLYSPIVKPGGLIALHDILPRPDDPTIQVDRFWQEIKERCAGKELVGDPASGRQIGIGVIRPPLPPGEVGGSAAG
jgi:predicted O-methyltransferase YrrM